MIEISVYGNGNYTPRIPDRSASPINDNANKVYIVNSYTLLIFKGSVFHYGKYYNEIHLLPFRFRLVSTLDSHYVGLQRGGGFSGRLHRAQGTSVALGALYFNFCLCANRAISR